LTLPALLLSTHYSQSLLLRPRLDLVGFGTDGGILRRLITEMGPVRAAKTVVRAFIVDIDCHQLGAVLVNDVTACAPGEPGTCLDGLGRCARGHQ
jgi:hypothetical protein